MTLPSPDDDPIGVLLGGEYPGIARLNPAPGKYMLMPGVPLDPPPPNPDREPVAILDTGILSHHPQLKNLIVTQADFTGEGPEDHNGHGTIVALQAVKPFEGQERLPDLGSTPLMNAKVADAQGQVRKRWLMDGIRWAVDQGARVLNLSLGFTGPAVLFKDLCALIESYPQAIFVAAAGNFGPDVPTYPAACGASNLMSVGAVDAAGQVADYSGRGDIYASADVRLVSNGYYLLQEGNRAAREGRLDEARLLYTQALAEEPLADAAFQLGVLDIHEQKLDSALEKLAYALELAPEAGIIHTHIGAVWMIRGDDARALPYLERGVELNPGVAMGHFNRGVALMNLGRLAEALESFTQTARLDPNYPGLARAMMQAKRAANT